MRGSRRDGHLKHHVILRVWKERPPKKIDRLTMANGGEPPNDRVHSRGRQSDPGTWPAGDVVILRQKRDRQSQLETPRISRQKDLVAGSRRRTHGSDEDIGVDHSSDHMGSYTIPPMMSRYALGLGRTDRRLQSASPCALLSALCSSFRLRAASAREGMGGNTIPPSYWVATLAPELGRVMTRWVGLRPYLEGSYMASILAGGATVSPSAMTRTR